MTSAALQWPALGVEEPRFPRSIEVQRAVFGKVHGAPTDFRWIAKSANFGERRPDIAPQLNLGGEDLPARFQAWRNLGDRCFAITAYPSRAVDAAGRHDFLEKQVLEWRRPPDVPAILGALVLLPAVAKLGDDIWWGRSVPFDGDDHLLIDAAEHQPIEIEAGAIVDVIERGRQILRDTVSSRMLEILFAQLLAGRSPTILDGLLEPLPPEALAALLLPLPREIADHVSITGWIPTSRPSFEDLGTRWNILTAAPEHTVPRVQSAASDHAVEMAEELLATEAAPFRQFVDRVRPAVAPPAAIAVKSAEVRQWPGLTLDLPRPNIQNNEVLDELWEFACAPNRRWLDPRELRGRRLPKPSDARVLYDWVHGVRKERPSYAHEEQWTVKVDLLRSAALVLAPHLSTWQIVGAPESGRVPILIFALMMDSMPQWNRLEPLGQKTLIEAIRQSATCGPLYWTPLRERLQKWQGIRPELRPVIEEALNPERK